jgi:ABC-type polysaccharide/polyol phosphate transport system ATPase subunit
MIRVVPPASPAVYSRRLQTAYDQKERVMALPTLTPEQRQQALEKAAIARKKRAELKGQLKSGKKTLKDVLSSSGDPTVGKMKVTNVLESLPGVGKVRAQKLMEELDISATRRVQGLGAKQREMLLDRFAKR